MTKTEDFAHNAVLKEWLYWYDYLKSQEIDRFSYHHLSTVGDPIAITASNLTIASLKWMEE